MNELEILETAGRKECAVSTPSIIFSACECSDKNLLCSVSECLGKHLLKKSDLSQLNMN